MISIKKDIEVIRSFWLYLGFISLLLIYIFLSPIIAESICFNKTQNLDNHLVDPSLETKILTTNKLDQASYQFDQQLKCEYSILRFHIPSLYTFLNN